jgi:hypothetical protein
VSIFVSEVRHFLSLGMPSGLPIMSATAQTDRQLGRHGHLGPAWYSQTLRARSGPCPLGGYCHLSHIGRQTCVNPCGLSFAFPHTDRSGPDRLFRRDIARLCGWSP